jgi:hypothetical protein
MVIENLQYLSMKKVVYNEKVIENNFFIENSFK